MYVPLKTPPMSSKWNFRGTVPGRPDLLVWVSNNLKKFVQQKMKDGTSKWFAVKKTVRAGETCSDPHCASCDAGVSHEDDHADV